MTFVSIRKKLIDQVSRILLVSFLLLIVVVTGINLFISEGNLNKSEEHIRAALSAKAQLLVSNNGQALIGMAEDYAFTSVKSLVESTVQDDPDILYGIFMDVDAMPWVIAGEYSSNSSETSNGESLTDDVSVWAANLEQTDHKTIYMGNEEVWEYVSPIVSNEETLGFIRYGFSTSAMAQSLETASQESQQQSILTSILLALLAASAVGAAVIFVRKMANAMTQPLQQLTQSAEVISAGDYSSEIVVNSNDEIGVLAKNFDTMRSTISKKMDDLSVLNTYGDKLARTQRRHLAIEQAAKGFADHFHAHSVWAFRVFENTLIAEFQSNKTGQYPVFGESLLQLLLTHEHHNKAFVLSNDLPLLADFKSRGSSCLAMPIVDDGKVTEMLVAQVPNVMTDIERGDEDFCTSLSRSLSTSLKNIDMREVIEEQNRTLEQKVEERTAALQEKTNDIMCMMENMHQGLLTVTRSGQVHPEYAAYCETIFETKEIAEQEAMALLFARSNLGSNVTDQIKTALDALLGEDEMMWDFNSHLLVNEAQIAFEDGREKTLEFDWDPIVLEDEIDKIMVTVRDVTALRSLQAEADAQKHELEIIGQILAVEESKFADFIHSSHGYIEKCEGLIKANSSKSLEVVAELFRNMHTVKGNARTFGFSHITDSVHEAETVYDQLRKEEFKPWESDALLADLDKVKQDLAQYQETAVSKLGRDMKLDSANSAKSGEAALRLIQSTHHALTQPLSDDVYELLSQTHDYLIEQHALSLTEVLSSVVRSTQSLAKELDKPEPNIHINDKGLLLRAEYQQSIQDVFMHLMRNSLDHGIESEQDRVAAGKPGAGQIQLQQVIAGDKVSLILHDDGRGLPLHKLLEKGEAQGAFNGVPSATEVAQLIFDSGMSTAEKVSLVSGRGVGMEAVKQFVEDMGGCIHLRLNDPAAELDTFAPFELCVELPKRFFYEKLQPNLHAA